MAYIYNNRCHFPAIPLYESYLRKICDLLRHKVAPQIAHISCDKYDQSSPQQSLWDCKVGTFGPYEPPKVVQGCESGTTRVETPMGSLSEGANLVRRP